MNRKIRGMLNEGLYPGLMGIEDFWAIWSGFKFMFKSIQLAIKNFLGTSSYIYKLMITTDPDEIKKIKLENEKRMEALRKEQDAAYSDFSRSMDDMAEADLHFIAAVISPAEYAAYQGASYLYEPGEDTDKEDSGNLSSSVDFLDDALLNEEIRALRKIRMLISEESEKVSKKISSSYTLQNMIAEKKRQIEQAINILQAPQNFIKKVSEAKDIAEIDSSFSVLAGTPYKFEKNISKEKLKLDAKKMAENAIKSNSQQEILNIIGKKIENPTAKDIEETCEVILTKSAIKDLGEQIADPQKNPFKKTTEELRAYFIANIIGPLDKDPKIVEILKLDENGKKYLQILSDGKKALETAAK